MFYKLLFVLSVSIVTYVVLALVGTVALMLNTLHPMLGSMLLVTMLLFVFAVPIRFPAKRK